MSAVFLIRGGISSHLILLHNLVHYHIIGPLPPHCFILLSSQFWSPLLIISPLHLLRPRRPIFFPRSQSHSLTPLPPYFLPPHTTLLPPPKKLVLIFLAWMLPTDIDGKMHFKINISNHIVSCYCCPFLAALFTRMLRNLVKSKIGAPDQLMSSHLTTGSPYFLWQENIIIKFPKQKCLKTSLKDLRLWSALLLLQQWKVIVHILVALHFLHQSNF